MRSILEVARARKKERDEAVLILPMVESKRQACKRRHGSLGRGKWQVRLAHWPRWGCPGLDLCELRKWRRSTGTCEPPAGARSSAGRSGSCAGSAPKGDICPRPVPLAFLFLSVSWRCSRESACNTGDARDLDSIPGSGGSPGGRNGNPLQCCCPKNSTDRGAWSAVVTGITESDVTEDTHTHTHNVCRSSYRWKLKKEKCLFSPFLEPILSLWGWSLLVSLLFLEHKVPAICDAVSQDKLFRASGLSLLNVRVEVNHLQGPFQTAVL